MQKREIAKKMGEFMKANKLTTLIIMDGVGIPTDLSVSAVLPENTTNLQYYATQYPHGKLQASGNAVGLPATQTGTSDVGHLTIGTGRVNYQPLMRINNAIVSGEFFNNEAIMKAVLNANKNNVPLHLVGIASDGGVHSHIDHLLALIKLASENKVKKVYIHFISDGRDTPQKSAKKYYDIVENAIKKYNCGEIVDIVGRFYALDRDNNWDRVKIAYDAYTLGVGTKTQDLMSSVLKAYKKGESDEFLMPIIKEKNGNPVGRINEGDSVIIFNYRADRERQLARVFSNDNNFDWTKKLNLTLVTMTNYDESLGGVIVAFDNVQIRNILSEILSKNGYNQLKVAETEKFAYITFAFNAGRNEPYENEERVLISSEKLKTYDVKPQMCAREIADATVKGIESGKYDVIIINFANGDMVGHSGSLEATKIAIGVVDECVKKVVDATLSVGGRAIITADHGNSDIMVYPDGSPHKSHTMALVPVIIADRDLDPKTPEISGTLADIAPTILKLLGEKIPPEMTGKPLI